MLSLLLSAPTVNESVNDIFPPPNDDEDCEGCDPTGTILVNYDNPFFTVNKNGNIIKQGIIVAENSTSLDNVTEEITVEIRYKHWREVKETTPIEPYLATPVNWPREYNYKN